MTIYRIIRKDYMGMKEEMGFYKKHSQALEEVKRLEEIHKKSCFSPVTYILERITVK